MDVDHLQINFNESAQGLLQVILAFVMFSIAIDTTLKDFRSIVYQYKAVTVGVIAQFLLFPMLTYLLITFLTKVVGMEIAPSIMLGMYLLAACPGGNMSNFLSHLAGGNTPLSVILSAISTLVAVIMIPLNFEFWALRTPQTAILLKEVSLSFWDLASSVVILLLFPMILGLLAQYVIPNFIQKYKGLIKKIATVCFVLLTIGAFVANWKNFLTYIHFVALVVIVQNLLAFALGYVWAKSSKLNERDCRTISIETGIQNSGLGLILALQFFPTLGGAALVAAWWSIWHAIAGGSLAYFWNKIKPIKSETK